MNSKTYTGYRWELIFLLCLAFFFHQADRAIFGVLLKQIQTAFHLSNEQLGIIGSALFATLALMMPFAGWLGDRFSKKWIITICILFWSTATAMTGLATGFIGLLLFRSIATAGGESFYAPSAYPMIAAWHKKTRSIALALHQGALYIGVMSSGYIAGYIADRYNWRIAFIAFGLCGIILGLIFIFRLRPMPKEDNQQTEVPVEKQLISTADKKNSIPSTGDSQNDYSFWQSVCFLCKVPTFWLLTLGFSAVVFVNNAYIYWSPALVSDKFPEISLTAAGGGAMFYHHLAALIGILFGGFLTDALVKKFVKTRLWLQSFAMLLGFPMILLMAKAPTLNGLTGMWMTMALFGLFRGLYETNTHAAVFDVVPPKMRSTAVAFMTMIAFWLGALSPLILGFYRKFYGERTGLAEGFSLLAYSYLIGAVALFIALFVTFKKDRYIEK